MSDISKSSSKVYYNSKYNEYFQYPESIINNYDKLLTEWKKRNPYHISRITKNYPTYDELLKEERIINKMLGIVGVVDAGAKTVGGVIKGGGKAVDSFTNMLYDDFVVADSDSFSTLLEKIGSYFLLEF